MDENEKRKELAVYLQDHYAGAVAAIEMLEHLIKTHAGKPLERFFTKLHADVTLDHEQLRNVMTVLGFQESIVRDISAWMAEKLARAKLGFSNGKTVGLRLVESLEILQLGITGKRLLWRAMSAAIKSSPVPSAERFHCSRKASDEAIRTRGGEAARGGAPRLGPRETLIATGRKQELNLDNLRIRVGSKGRS